MNLLELKCHINNNETEKIKEFMDNNDLELKGNRIISKNSEKINQIVDYWDKRQLVTKIMLNSV